MRAWTVRKKRPKLIVKMRNLAYLDLMLEKLQREIHRLRKLHLKKNVSMVKKNPGAKTVRVLRFASMERTRHIARTVGGLRSANAER